MIVKIRLTLIAIVFGANAYSQGTGFISGSFESKTHYYFDDNRLGVSAPQNRLASNNYLWVQFGLGPLTGGIQYEGYMPPLSGYPYQLEGNNISHRFLRFRKDIIDITAGNFYDQFGSGMSFRAYEDRYLGINNSVDGVRVIVKPTKGIKLKGIYGKQRKYTDYSDSYLRGFDSEFGLNNLPGMAHNLTVGAGVISKYEPYTGPINNFPSVVNAYNIRINTNLKSIFFNSEFVYKSEDPILTNLFERVSGKAFKADLTYTPTGIGVYIATRFLDNIYFKNSRSSTDSYSNINYLPSNSRQHTYFLPNIYPFPAQSGSEGSVQADVNYFVPGNSKLGGKYGTGLRLNYSLARNLANDGNGGYILFSFGNKLLFSDINFEINRKWNRKLRTILMVQGIAYNQGAVEAGGDDLIKAQILVADLRYKITGKLSFKSEFQHLWSENDHGNWYAGKLEVSYAPTWSFYIYDLSDYEYSNQVHYLNTGISMNHKSLRISIGYGRNRAGYVCSGGVCHLVPAYKGFSLNLTSSF